MSREFGPFSTAKKIVVLNPDNPSQVRQVSGSGSPQWVSVASGTFSECVTATSATGALNFADMPSGLSAATDYQILAFDSAATAFSDSFDLYNYTAPDDSSPSAEGGLVIVETDSDDYDLAAGANVLTWSGSEDTKKLTLSIILGDTGTVAKQLSGGDEIDVSVSITVGGILMETRYFTIAAGIKQRQLPEILVFAPANDAIVATVTSPAAEDGDVTVTAYLCELQGSGGGDVTIEEQDVVIE